MLAALLVDPVPYAELSQLRWAAFCAAKECIEKRAGKYVVDSHVAELELVGVPSEVFQSAAVPTKFARIGKILCDRAVSLATKTYDGDTKEVSDDSPGSLASLVAGSPQSGASLDEHLIKMAQGCGRYWGYVALGDASAANRAWYFALRSFHAAHWKQPAWRGANLGGWLLLEPGPASPFYEMCKETIEKAKGGVAAADVRSGEAAWLEDESESSLCKALVQAGGPALRQQMFAKHRATHYTKSTFDDIRKIGLNAVRVPFGYWVVTGPADGEAFDGPCLEALDSAVSMASSHGLQVLLDLHGNPGGESGERPCGCKNDKWDWTSWRTQEAVNVLAQVASRYKDSECVTGMQVCNEPSMRIPVDVLCGYYEAAIDAIRGAGMGADRVAIVLPVFNQMRLPEIWKYWQDRGNFFKYDNVAFDLHYYHTFSSFWKLLSQEQHIEIVQSHACELASLPGAIVGEWSLSRPDSDKFSDEDMRNWATQQVLAYNHASHGWFFWNWHDYERYTNWDMERGVFGRGRLPNPLGDHLINDVLFPEWEDDEWSKVPASVPSQSWIPWVMSYLPFVQHFLSRVERGMCTSRPKGTNQ